MAAKCCCHATLVPAFHEQRARHLDGSFALALAIRLTIIEHRLKHDQKTIPSLEDICSVTDCS